MWTATLWNHEMLLLQWGVAVGASLVGAVWDIRTRRIPNWLTGPVLATGLVYAGWMGGPAGFADALCGCFILAVPYVFLFAFAGGGAGDAKLMGALGAWLGLLNGIIVLFCVAVSGIILAVAFALAKRRLRIVLANLIRMTQHLLSAIWVVRMQGRLGAAPPVLPGTSNMQTMPYGVGVFAGVCIAVGGILTWRT